MDLPLEPGGETGGGRSLPDSVDSTPCFRHYPGGPASRSAMQENYGYFTPRSLPKR